MKNRLKIIIPTGISIVLSIALYQYLVAQFEQMKVTAGVKNDYSFYSPYSLYLHCFAFLFALIALPFILSAVSDKWPVKKSQIGIQLLLVEVLALILVWLFSTPDMLSRILIFGIWQIPIAANFISLGLRQRIDRTGKNKSSEPEKSNQSS